ncbi:hypothetical protein HGH46_02790 [Treponema vincentii]
MYNNKRHFFSFVAFLFIYFIMTVVSCKQSIGTPWYPRSVSDDAIPLYVGEITVAGAQVKADDAAESFAASSSYTVSVPNTLTDISIAQIKVKLFSDAKLEKEFPETSFTLEVAGDSVPLVTDSYIPVLLRIKPTGGQYAPVEKTLKVKRLPKSAAYLGGITVYGIAAIPAPDFAVSGNYMVTVPNAVEAVAKENIAASLFADEKQENALSGSTIAVTGGTVQLAPDVPAAVMMTIIPPEPYETLQTTVMVTRETAQVAALSELVEIQEIKIQDKAARFVNGSYTLTLPNAVKKIAQSDIAVNLVTKDEAKTPVPEDTYSIRLLTGSSVPLGAGTPAYLAVEITLTQPAGQFIKIVKVTRERKIGGDSENPGDPSVPGDSEDEDDDIGGGGASNDENNDNTPDAGPAPIPPFDPNKPGSNPKDAGNHFKWILKTTETEIDPFDYYKSNSNGFSASKFDDWVVYISSFDNGTNVASYTFKNGTWSGSPECYRGPDFGSGIKKTKNVDFYRYKTRKDRWEKHGGYQPDVDPHDERFYFYRFTGKTLSPTLDNSMFCVDRYSKFLFYYSDPRDIDWQGVPSEWRDYAQPTEGKHKHFDEPFYMSDPVGYVEADGTVVMYEWIKNNITANNYTAQKNSAYDKPAERDPGKPGYSPYRDKIKGTPKTEWVENPEYTVTSVTVKKEPESREVIQGAKGWFVQAIPNAVPQGEQLSYQWYVNTVESTEGGTPVSDGKGGTDAAYYFSTDAAKEVYYYCTITNTNPTNGKSVSVQSKAVKVTVKKGMAVVHISKPKKGGTLSVTMGGQSIEDGAEIERGSVLTLTATLETDYAVASWINAKPREDNPLVADATVTQDITVGVKLKSTAAPPAPKIKLYFFSNDEQKGLLKAEINGTALEGGKTGVDVEKGSIVTFTAIPASEDYKLNRWNGNVEGAGTSPTLTVTIKETTTVAAEFALKRFPVNYVCEPVEGGVITATADGQSLAESGTEVEKYKNVTFKATARDGYYLDHWDGWEGASAAGENDTVQVKVLNKVSVKAVFKRLYPVVFTSNDENKGTVTAKVNGESIESGTKVREGQNVTFTATPKPGFCVKDWKGATPQTAVPQKEPMEATIAVSGSITVNVDFAKIMRLTVTPKIQNVDLQSWSTEGSTDHFSPKYIDGVHLAHDLVVSVQGDGNAKSKKWEYSFEYKHGSGGKGDYVAESDFIKNGESKTHGSALIDTDYTAFSDLKIGLTNYLVKSNRHDYCRTEYTYTIWPVPEPALFRKQCLDNNSVFVLEYNESEGKWVVNSNAVHINQVDADGDGITDDVPQLPRPAGFENMDHNYKTISFKGVTISYDENFTLADGEEKDFVITYKVDNDPDSPNLKKKKDGTPTGTRSKGTVKVIYTIGWKLSTN